MELDSFTLLHYCIVELKLFAALYHAVVWNLSMNCLPDPKSCCGMELELFSLPCDIKSDCSGYFLQLYCMYL